MILTILLYVFVFSTIWLAIGLAGVWFANKHEALGNESDQMDVLLSGPFFWVVLFLLRLIELVTK